MTRLLTNSALSAFRRCPRLYLHRYVQGLRPLIAADAALNFGTLFHKGLERFWDPEEYDDRALDAALGVFADLDAHERAYAGELMRGYEARWAEDGLVPVAVEQKFLAPIIDPVTGKQVEGWLLAGKVDAIVKDSMRGRHLFMEHKTAGVDISPGSAYWLRLRMDTQVGFYTEGMKSLGYEDATCMYDVIRKPDLDPYQKTPEEKLRRRKDGAPYANQRLMDETAWEYRGRIQAAIAADPERYYQRAEVVRLESEQDAMMRDAVDYIAMIQKAEQWGYPRNPDACFAYGRACDYFRICSGSGNADDGNYVRVANVHPELED